jgi:hypothetical protein
LNVEAYARVRLAEMGYDSKENLEVALSLCDYAKKHLTEKRALRCFVWISSQKPMRVN